MHIKDLYRYPVSSMGGEKVKTLTLTPTHIEGNRVFTVVPEAELATCFEDQSQIPRKLPLTRSPGLALFTARTTENGLLSLTHQNEVFDSTLPVAVQLPDANKQYLTEPQRQFPRVKDFRDLLDICFFPLRVSSHSSTVRWAEDCGDNVATFISDRLNKKVRLYKFIGSSESPKWHATWYTDLHIIFSHSLLQLAQDIEQPNITHEPFRPNAIIQVNEEKQQTFLPYQELRLPQLKIGEVIYDAKECQRCGYVNIDLGTGTLTNASVLKYIVQNHNQNFGIYASPKATEPSIEITTGMSVVID